jgi:hypothetical protein
VEAKMWGAFWRHFYWFFDQKDNFLEIFLQF